MSEELIFIVGDDATHSQMIEKELNSKGFNNIKKIQSGGLCLEQMGQHPYMVLSEQKLSDMEGAFLINSIKRQKCETHTILFTETCVGKEIISAMKRGSTIILKDEDDTLEMLHESLDLLCKAY